MARTTVGSLVKRVRRQLHSGGRNEYNRLDGGINASVSTVVFEFGLVNSMQVGAVINVDLELMRVVSVDTTAKSATVIRGWLDTEAVAHLDDAEVIINPRFSLIDIYDAMIEEIESWGPQLYKVDGDQFDVEIGTETLELPAVWASCFGVVSAMRQPEADWVGASTAWPDVQFRLQRGTTAWTDGASSSGLLLRFPESLNAVKLFVSVAMPYVAGTPALTDDLVDDLGIPMSMLDVLAMGTKLRIVQDGEWARTARSAQDDSRRAEELQPGQTFAPIQFGVITYKNRKQEEINKLRAQYPIKAM